MIFSSTFFVTVQVFLGYAKFFFRSINLILVAALGDFFQLTQTERFVSLLFAEGARPPAWFSVVSDNGFCRDELPYYCKEEGHPGIYQLIYVMGVFLVEH